MRRVGMRRLLELRAASAAIFGETRLRFQSLQGYPRRGGGGCTAGIHITLDSIFYNLRYSTIRHFTSGRRARSLDVGAAPRRFSSRCCKIVIIILLQSDSVAAATVARTTRWAHSCPPTLRPMGRDPY
jgi:hypothetical protein